MSSLNGPGQILHGIAGGNASIDNVPFSPGAAGGWFDDRTAFFADATNAWIVSLYDARTGRRRPAVEDPANPYYGQSANVIYADGSVWAAMGGAGVGLYASTGFANVDAGLLAVGPDGEIGYKPIYQSGGPSVARERDGQEWQITDGHATDLMLLGRGRAIWQEGGTIRSRGLPPAKQVGTAWRPQAYLINATWWISYFCTERGIVLHPIGNLTGYVIAPAVPDCWANGRVLTNGTLRFALSSGPGEQAGQLRPHDVDFSLPRTDLTYAPPPDPVPVTPPEPRSDAILSSTVPYDLLFYIRGDASTFPRKGPTHPMHQHVDGTLLFFVKFGTDLPAPYVPGEAYEMWAWDANWIYHLEDASAEPYSFADSRWFPRRMLVGQTKRFELADEVRYHNRVTCDRWRTDHAARRMWLHAAYAKYYWGADLGERATIVVAYDPTGGQDLANRNVELGFYALGAGAVRWQSYRADKVYVNGYDKPAVFHPDAIWAQSDFYLLGGPALLPKRTACVGDVVPHYPPFDPYPTPVPPKPVPQHHTHTKGLSMDLNGKTVVLRGPGGKLMRPDAPNTGIWATLNAGWRGVIWDGLDKHDARYHHRATKVENDNYALVHVGNNGLAGADATKHSTGLDKQGYYKPDGNADRGGYETWRVYDGNENGAVQGQIEYDNDEGKYFAASVAIEVV